MRRLISLALLLLLLLALVPVQSQVMAGAVPQVTVKSEFTLNRYGYAVINETVTFWNNFTSSFPPPPIQLGLGNLSSLVVGSVVAGEGFTMSSGAAGGPYTVQTDRSLAAGSTASFTLSALINGVLSPAKNGTLKVLTLSSPSVNLPVRKLQEVVTLPASTTLASPPLGLVRSPTGGNGTYSRTLADVAQPSAASSVRAVVQAGSTDFHPLVVYGASRTVSVGLGAAPLVTDSLRFKNLGSTPLSTLHISPLTLATAQVTVVPSKEPRLLNPVTVTLTGGAISLSNPALGYPVPAGSNYTITYQYALDSRYYSVSGGQVTLNLPETPPIQAFVGSYSIGISVPAGVSVTMGPPQPFANASPWQSGRATLAYGLAVGWAVEQGVPAAAAIFVLLLVGLFASRTTMTEEEETEEETSTERASAMIKAFDEKTGLINGLWSEIEGKDPNEVSREYFDELRGRLDAFRSRALQRLNEVKQKSTTQRFFDLLSQIHATEREVDRAAKDKLNLYEQYHMKRMRREVFDRLLPQYTKRLERALNQLTDELHSVQREAKLL